jgi:hypothetical protein
MSPGFYAYLTDTPDTPGMSDEPLGTSSRWIWMDIKTIPAAVNRLSKVHGWKLFMFTNIYDNRTFRLVATGGE